MDDARQPQGGQGFGRGWVPLSRDIGLGYEPPLTGAAGAWGAGCLDFARHERGGCSLPLRGGSGRASCQRVGRCSPASSSLRSSRPNHGPGTR